MTVTLDSRVRDVLAACPPTGEIFIQYGTFSRHEPGALYPTYDPGLTVGAFAVKAGRDPMSLLNLLSAAAEDCDRAYQLVHKSKERLTARRRRATPPPTIGYTGSYREPSGDVDVRPVVEVQTARGPV